MPKRLPLVPPLGKWDFLYANGKYARISDRGNVAKSSLLHVDII